MNSRSKQSNVLEAFYNHPSREWHFVELLKECSISRKQLSAWLKLFLKQTLIYREKPRRKMPYYTANYNSPAYQNRKRLFVLNQLCETGLLDYLATIPRVQTVVLFGSTTRWDWHKESDIDLFIHGNPSELALGKYELELGRDIQVFVADEKTIKNLPQKLLTNIAKGYIIRGNLDGLMAYA